MKSGLALLLLVAVAGLAECMPSKDLQALVQARVAKLSTRGRGKNGGKDGGNDNDYPYGWIEYSSLVGKCVEALTWLEMFEIDPESAEGVLSEACPKAFEGGEEMQKASEEELKAIGAFLNEIFPLLQCVNLQAEKEAVTFALIAAEKSVEDNIFLQESRPLFEVCEQLFESVEDEIKEFEGDVNKMEDNDQSRRDNKIRALIRQLINTASKKR